MSKEKPTRLEKAIDNLFCERYNDDDRPEEATIVKVVYALGDWVRGYQKFLEGITTEPCDEKYAKDYGYVAMRLEKLAHDISLLETFKD